MDKKLQPCQTLKFWVWLLIHVLIKSFRYTGGDFMFLYWFVRRRPQILVHTITFEQLLWFLSFWHDCWPWPIGYLIRFWSIFGMTLTLNFQGQIRKQTYRLISRPQMWPSVLTLAMTLTLNFQGQIWNWLYLCQKWSDCHETNSKHIDWTLGLKR